MRILILSQWFDPEPTFKGLPFARELMRLGHEVEVLTGFPNYPGGKLYPGYTVKFLQRENIDGISVIRVPLYPSHDTSAIRRVFNYLSFAFSAAIMGPFLVRRADVMYVYHPPVTVGLPAIVIRLLRGIPFVYDIQDLWPDTLASTGMVNNRFILACVGLWCKLVYSFAKHIVVLSPGFKRILAERGVPADKISLIYNWCDESKLNDGRAALSPQDADVFNGRFNVVFAGTMGKAQGMDAVIDAARLVQATHPKIQFVFVGGGVDADRLASRVSAEQISNVIFLPRRKLAEVAPLLAAADALLVHLRPDPLFAITIPSKIQAYLAMGRPILIAVDGDAVSMVNESGAGIYCKPGNPESIAAGVKKIFELSPDARSKMGAAGREYYHSLLSLNSGARAFDSIFRKLPGML